MPPAGCWHRTQYCKHKQHGMPGNTATISSMPDKHICFERQVRLVDTHEQHTRLLLSTPTQRWRSPHCTLTLRAACSPKSSQHCVKGDAASHAPLMLLPQPPLLSFLWQLAGRQRHGEEPPGPLLLLLRGRRLGLSLLLAGPLAFCLLSAASREARPGLTALAGLPCPAATLRPCRH